MKRPPYLKTGDKVAIIPTARAVEYADIKAGIDLLNQWELETVIANNVGVYEGQLAGSDPLRVQCLQSLLDDPEVKAIWFAKGGYGTARILDKLDFTKFQEQPKWLIGYSDLTAIHSHIHNLGVCSIHGTMPSKIKDTSAEAIQSLYDKLFGKKTIYHINNDQSEFKDISGILVGGNVSLLYSLMGSVSAVDTQNKILFIEELDEYLYHFDRMIVGLKRSGIFKHIKALLVGGITDMKDDNAPSFGMNASQIIAYHTQEYNIPIFENIPCGHIKNNHALYFGMPTHLQWKKGGFTLSQDV